MFKMVNFTTTSLVNAANSKSNILAKTLNLVMNFEWSYHLSREKKFETNNKSSYTNNMT